MGTIGGPRRRAVLGLALTAPLAANARPIHATSNVEESELLSAHVDAGDSRGYVAIIVASNGAAAHLSAGHAAQVFDGDSVFEIGSITKVFTALLLADMVARNEVGLDDPVSRFLPPKGRPRAFEGREISLLDLATYTSGLPRMPGNFHPSDPANPYADYSVAQLDAFISGYEPHFSPGTHYEYANLGFGLLGHALALCAGRSFEELVLEQICAPLGMADTRITLTPAMAARLVPGHDNLLQPAANWDIPTLAGAGALRSTANDLHIFLSACQGRSRTSLESAFASLLTVRRQAAGFGMQAALGWFVQTLLGDEIVLKDGGTGGYSTFIGYSTRTGRGAIVLADTASHNTTNLGKHLVNAEFPAPVMRRAVVLSADRLAALAGRYALTPDFVLTVTPRDGRLMVQATGQAEYQVLAQSPTMFFYRAVDAQLTFELAADGQAAAVALHQNGRVRRGVRQ
jgi:D-alanyl-D-alanine-carboxypeptidase/D-alanyl-D-alanine-endopeptidase